MITSTFSFFHDLFIEVTESTGFLIFIYQLLIYGWIDNSVFIKETNFNNGLALSYILNEALYSKF